MAYDILARDGRPIKKDGDPVKAMDITVEKIEQLDESEKSFVAVASTEDEDRDKDIVRQNGWDLKNFKKNPMIPWSHNYWGIPIAKSLRTWVDKKVNKLLFKPKFDPDDDESMKIFNKYKNGFLTSFSVGFRGIEMNWRDEENHWSGGMEFVKQELLEISAVTIPANPNATVNVNDITESQNLLQLGYAPYFAKTESGLFYPVRQQLAEYYHPEVKAIEDMDGVQEVYAKVFDSEDELTVVGYYFDPEKWSIGEIKTWITDNNEPTYKQHYYNWKKSDENWEVDTIEEEAKLPVFDEPKVLTSDDVAAAAQDDSDIDADADADEKSQEEILFELGKALEIMVNEQMLKMADALATAFDNVFDKILVELDGIKKLIIKKDVAPILKIDDNNDDIVPDDSISKNDDEIEIDDSLISPNDDKSNSDEIIEIDDDTFGNNNIVVNSVNSIFQQKLKEIFVNVKKDKVNIEF